MERKAKIDLDEVFNEPDRRLLLHKFDALVRHLCLDRADCCCRLGGGQCHDINQVVSIITDKLIHLVTTSKSDLKFEASLYAIPWAKYLFETIGPDGYSSNVNRLRSDVFVKLWTEYVQIFPHKSDKFIDSFMFLLRGYKDAYDDTLLSAEESALFTGLKSAMKVLLRNVHTFQLSLMSSLKKRYPFYHNANVHEFVCYIGNLVNISELLPDEHFLELYQLIFNHLLAIDTKQFFEEVSENHVCDKENHIIFEFEDLSSTATLTASNTSVTVDERLKKFKVLDAACKLFFEYIDRQLPTTGDNSRAVTALISLFFSRLLTGGSIHLQYLAFYLAGRSPVVADAFVNDLWTISVSGSEPLAVREGAFSYLVSLLLHAQYVHLNTVFSFLKILIQSMNAHLDAKLAVSGSSETPSSSIDHDVMYYNFAIGFARLFTAFHSDLARIQVDCLKSMDVKRALLNDHLAPMHYFPSELRSNFHVLATHYRIGYVNGNVLKGPLGATRTKELSSLSGAHREHPPKFGRIRLPSVRAAIAPLANNIEALCEPLPDYLRTSFGAGRGWSEKRRSHSGAAFGRQLATSPTTTNTSGDDYGGGLVSSPNSFTPSSSILMASMLSDMD